MARSTAASSLTPSRSLVARVRRFIVERQLIGAGDRVLAAVSGGPDSTCLLLVLAALRRSLKVELHAAYFDHKLRGSRAAANEQRFVRALCERLDVPFHLGSGDVRGHKATAHVSLEEAARELRYAFLARTARRFSYSAVATGHTRDDQAETVLLHVIRGTGLRGLAGMAASAPLPTSTRNAARLIRPLLCLTLADTEGCCDDAGLEPIEDPSNRSPAHLRNRVRHELLPLLREVNPRIEEALLRLASAAGLDDAAARAVAKALLADAYVKNGVLRLPRGMLADLPSEALPYVIIAAIERLSGSARSISERHLAAVRRAALGPAGIALDLPRGLHLEVQHRALVFSAGVRPTPTPGRRVRLAVPGTTRFGAWSVRAELLDSRPRRLAAANGVPTAVLDADALGRSVWLRPRRPGDRYQPLGLDHAKKLQDVLVDAHVPRSERDGLPLVCGRGGIAWVAGQPPADWAKVRPTTRRAVRLRARRRGA
jgi:tRNA(Ile)-lysidine synthase